MSPTRPFFMPASHWLPAFQATLDVDSTLRTRLDVLEAAWIETDGQGDAWCAALTMALRYGFVEGCEAMLQWEVPVGATLMQSLRRSALQRASEAQRIHNVTRPDDALMPFIKADGTRFAGVSHKRGSLIADAFFGVTTGPVPANTLKDLQYYNRMDLIAAVMEREQVQPWGGAALRRQLIEVVGSTLKRVDLGAVVESKIFKIIVDRCPTGFHRGPDADNLFKTVCREVDKRGLKQNDFINNPVLLQSGIELLTAAGFDLPELCDKWKRHSSESLLACAIRYGDRALAEQVWQHQPTIDAVARPARQGLFVAGDDVFSLLARRINKMGTGPAVDAWWGLTQAMGASTAGLCLLRKRPKSAQVVWARDENAAHWTALLRTAVLERRFKLPKRDEVEPVRSRPRM